MGTVDYSFADDPDGMFLSNSTRSQIEHEVKVLVDQAYADAYDLIIKERASLNGIACGLLENDTLTGDEMKKVCARRRR